MTANACGVAGCTLPVREDGLCLRHNNLLILGDPGDPEVLAAQAVLAGRPQPSSGSTAAAAGTDDITPPERSHEMAEDKTCAVPGCGKPRVGRGLCQRHYRRLSGKDGPLKDEALRYAGEPRRRGGTAGGDTPAKPAAAKPAEPARRHLSPAPVHGCVDIVAVLRALGVEADAIGLECGLLICVPSTGRVAVVTRAGSVSAATLEVANP